MARAPAPGKSSDKSERAFRTISEAAEIIGVPQHVLRFWETRFPQLQPLKRGGNRRYYRPADMALLETIRAMLHDRGLTIRGARLALEADDAPIADTEAETMASPVAALADPLEPEIPSVPITVPAMAAPAPAGVDLVALKTIRDRLRLALAA